MNDRPRACINIRLVTALTVVLASLVLWGIIVLAVWAALELASTEFASALASLMGAGRWL